MRFVVAQIGARHAYAVPAALERAGLLEHFYTDLTADTGVGGWLVKWGPLLGAGRMSQRLARRRLPECIRAKTTTLGWATLRHGCYRALCRPGPEENFRRQLRWDRALGTAMVRQGFGQGTHFYSMLGECAPMLAEAKRRELGTAVEIYILLSAERILKREQAAFPGWESAAPDFDAIRREFSEKHHVLASADLAVCPSEAVRRDVVKEFAFPAERTALVPYGVEKGWFSVEPSPVKGRVLFAGTAGLRKGIQYLARAARLLREHGRNYEFQTAGDVPNLVARQPDCRCLNFLGRVTPERLRELYRTADVFVLPTLAEGSATVTYEALASGVPVITTPAAGSVVRDGVDGRIIAERDAAVLAGTLETIIENRPLRDRLSRAARQRAHDYEREKYGARLVAALQFLAR